MVLKGGVPAQAHYQPGALNVLNQWLAGKPFADVNHYAIGR